MKAVGVTTCGGCEHVQIHNQAIVRLFDLDPNIPIASLWGVPDNVDVTLWILEGLLAAWLGSWVFQRMTKKENGQNRQDA